MKVSILIATYGASVWAEMAEERAYLSARAQKARVHLCHIPEATISQVRNAAAERAKGDWLCFLDADDELGPGYIEAMQRAWERESRGGERAPDGPPLLLTPAVSYVRKGRPSPPQFLDRGIPLTQDNWLVVGTLIEKSLFMEVGGFGDYPHGFEDFSLWSKCWRRGVRIVKVPDAVYRAHVNPRSQHRQGWRDRKWQVATHQRVVRELDAWEQAR